MRVVLGMAATGRSNQPVGAKVEGEGIEASFRAMGPMQRPIPIHAGRIRMHLPAVGEMTQTYENNVLSARAA